MAGWDEAVAVAREWATRPFDLSRRRWRGLFWSLLVSPKRAAVPLRPSASNGCCASAFTTLWLTGVPLRCCWKRCGHATLRSSAAKLAPRRRRSVRITPDFVIWERANSTSERARRELAFWKARLQGAPPALDVPTDHPRPAVQSRHGGRVQVDEPGGCRRPAGSSHTSLGYSADGDARAWAAVLSRHSGQPEVVIGLPVSGRAGAGSLSVVGPFVTTAPVRMDLDGSPSLVELAQRAKVAVLSALAHQDVRLEELVEELGMENDRSRHPIFQAVLNWQEADRRPVSWGDATMEPVSVEWGWSRSVDFRLHCTDLGDAVDVGLEFSTDLFETATAQRILDQLLRLIVAGSVDVDRALSEFSLVSPEERATLLAWGRGPRQEVPPGCAHEAVAAQAQARPAAVAVELGARSMTYGELDRAADALARRLAGLGLGPGAVVGVCLERSVELVVAMVAVMRAGAAYLPLDPAYPEARLAYIVADSATTAVVCSAALAAQAEAWGARAVVVGEGREAYPEAEPVPPGLDDLAYVLYTSGSTGTPKGVMVEHRGVANLAEVVRQTFALSPSSRVLQFASACFDASVTELLVPLTVGATVVMLSPEVAASGLDVLAVMERQQVSVATLPPSLLAVLPDAALPALVTLCSAGEACPPEVARRWGRGRRFLNGYGPTEATVAAAYYVVEDGPCPMGRPPCPWGRLSPTPRPMS